jgi:multiple sugar transport system permease protein
MSQNTAFRGRSEATRDHRPRSLTVRRTSARAVVYALLIVLGLLVVVPFLWMLVGSFTPDTELLSSEGETLLVRDPTIQNYVNLFQEYPFARYFLNSAFIGTVTAVFATSISAFAGYALARFRFPGRGVFGFLVLATQMLPGIAVIIPLFIWFRQFGLDNTYWAVLIAYNAFAIPFCTWMVRGFFLALPVELEEAAKIDGASDFGAFWRIVLPLSASGLIATAIFAFILAWQEFLFAVTFLNSTDLFTLTVGLAAMQGQSNIDYGLLDSGVVITTIPLAIVFSFVQRYLVRGLTSGALKG